MRKVVSILVREKRIEKSLFVEDWRCISCDVCCFRVRAYFSSFPGQAGTGAALSACRMRGVTCAAAPPSISSTAATVVAIVRVRRSEPDYPTTRLMDLDLDKNIRKAI